MFSRLPLAATVAAVLLAPAGAFAQEAAPPAAAPISSADLTKVVIRVGDTSITEADLKFAAEDFEQELAQVPADQRRRILGDVIVDMQLMANAATADGLDKSPEFTARMDFLKTRALRNAFFLDKVAGTVTDAEIKARYDEEVAKAEAPEEVHAFHILVPTKEDAEAIIKELDKGGDFAKLAKEKSQDPGSAEEGGDLGFFTAGQMVKPFEDAAFALPVGTYTKTPVQSDFGWHVIKVVEKRKQAAPELSQVAPQIRQLLVREKYDAVMASLRKDNKVEYVDTGLTPPAQPAVPTGTPAADAPATPAK